MPAELELITPEAKKSPDLPRFMVMIHTQIFLERATRLSADATEVSVLGYQVVANHVNLFCRVELA